MKFTVQPKPEFGYDWCDDDYVPYNSNEVPTFFALTGEPNKFERNLADVQPLVKTIATQWPGVDIMLVKFDTSNQMYEMKPDGTFVQSPVARQSWEHMYIEIGFRTDEDAVQFKLQYC